MNYSEYMKSIAPNMLFAYNKGNSNLFVVKAKNKKKAVEILKSKYLVNVRPLEIREASEQDYDNFVRIAHTV